MKRKNNVSGFLLTFLIVAGYMVNVRDNKSITENIKAAIQTKIQVNAATNNKEGDTSVTTIDISNINILKLVYDSLDYENKEKIGDNWESGLVDTVVINEETGVVDIEKHKGKAVYRIQYSNKDDSKIGSLTVYFDLENRELISYVYSN